MAKFDITADEFLLKYHSHAKAKWSAKRMICLMSRLPGNEWNKLTTEKQREVLNLAGYWK